MGYEDSGVRRNAQRTAAGAFRGGAKPLHKLVHEEVLFVPASNGPVLQLGAWGTGNRGGLKFCEICDSTGRIRHTDAKGASACGV